MSRPSVKGNLTGNGLISAFGTLSVGRPDGVTDWPLAVIVAQKGKTTKNIQQKRQRQPKALCSMRVVSAYSDQVRPGFGLPT
jgi:hypothetical protein